jgi:hypothetical protein
MQWAIWIQSTRWGKTPPVDAVRQTFESMGFVIHQQTFDYYNPTRHNRFIVEHARAGAVMLWQLGWSDHWPSCRVVIEEYHDH